MVFSGVVNTMNTKNKSLENPQTFQILKNESSTYKIDKGRRLRWVTKEANFVEKKKEHNNLFLSRR